MSPTRMAMNMQQPRLWLAWVLPTGAMPYIPANKGSYAACRECRQPERPEQHTAQHETQLCASCRWHLSQRRVRGGAPLAAHGHAGAAHTAFLDIVDTNDLVAFHGPPLEGWQL